MKFTFNPLAMWFKHPTDREIKEKQLRDAQIGLAEHMINREYHRAMSEMLRQRIDRLEAELQPACFECHITVSQKDAGEAKIVAAKWSCKTSEIARDPLLGDDTFFYITFHGDEYVTTLGKMHTISVALDRAGVKVIREKVERIVYDTKTGRK